MNIEKFTKLIKRGQIFHVKFVKKDGTERDMTARMGVAKYVKGTQPEVTEKRKDTLQANSMVTVYEMKGKTPTPEDQYRTLDVSKILVMQANGHLYNGEGELIK